MKKWLLAIISLVLAAALLCGCVSSDDMINEVKEQIPMVREFIGEQIENLTVLQAIQERLDGVVYAFSKDESIRVYEYSEGRWGKQATNTSISNYMHLNAIEVSSITEILRGIEDWHAFIHISPESIKILYLVYNRGIHVADLIIRNDDISKLAQYHDYHVEQVNSVWGISIIYWQRG